MEMKKVCIIGASGKLGRYMVQHCLDRGYEVVGVCRDQSVGKLDAFADRITIHPGRTDDREVIARAVTGCDGVLTVLAPWGVTDYSSGTAAAVMDHAEPHARLVFSCGWHITRDGQDRYSRLFLFVVWIASVLARWARLVDLDHLLGASDLVTLHAPLLDDTRGMVGAEQLARMRDGAWLVNTARGGLVDTDALTAEVVSGRLRAFVDTPDPEPLPADSLLYDHEGAVLTPHVAGSLGNETTRLGDLAVTEVERFVAGEPPLHPVVRADMDRIA